MSRRASLKDIISKITKNTELPFSKSLNFVLYYKKHTRNGIVLADKIESQTKAEKIFDIGVNTGVRRTSKFAQAAAGLSDKSLDGFIGKQSIQAINKTSDELFMLRLTVLQVAHYTNICKKRPDSRKFLVGWLKRALGEHI